MIAAIALSVVMLVLPPTGYHERVKATWYGSRGSHTHCYQGYRNTCTPYKSGELVMYAAVPGFRNYHTKPYPARVCSSRKCVMVVVRDCLCSRKGEYIDLSPAAFIALGYRLSRGVAWVSVDYDPYGGR